MKSKYKYYYNEKLGYLYNRIKEYKKAIPFLELAWESDEVNTHSCELIKAYWHTGKKKEAKQLFSKCFFIKPEPGCNFGFKFECNRNDDFCWTVREYDYKKEEFFKEECKSRSICYDIEKYISNFCDMQIDINKEPFINCHFCKLYNDIAIKYNDIVYKLIKYLEDFNLENYCNYYLSLIDHLYNNKIINIEEKIKMLSDNYDLCFESYYGADYSDKLAESLISGKQELCK
jgi:hypothetical protein